VRRCTGLTIFSERLLENRPVDAGVPEVRELKHLVADLNVALVAARELVMPLKPIVYGSWHW
jgi:hypothetical protein